MFNLSVMFRALLLSVSLGVISASAQETASAESVSNPGWPLTWTPLQAPHTGSWWSPVWQGGGLTVQVIEVEPNVRLALVHALGFSINGKPTWVAAQGLLRDSMRIHDPYPYYEFSGYLVDASHALPHYVGPLRIHSLNNGELQIELVSIATFPPPGYGFGDMPQGFSYVFKQLTQPVQGDFKACSWHGASMPWLSTDCFDAGPRIPTAP